jgi:hypothetical protein
MILDTFFSSMPQQNLYKLSEKNDGFAQLRGAFGDR